MANVIIHGGTFNSAQGDLNVNNQDSGLHILRLGVSLGAIHDSADRYPPPNCHHDTRKAVRQIILDWIHSENSASSSFWLYGPAGAGKTAILQAIAEFLCRSGQSFGGSFFFSRGKKGRDQGHLLFSTIAYQLALKVPGLRQHVNRIMELDPTLHTKSMDVQLQTLIVDAFQYLSPFPQRSYLVIIDGLDECHDKATQQMIIQLLFDKESLYTVTRRVVLDETFDPGRDIQVFLQDGFATICAKNPILSRVEQPWPEEGIIDLLVQRSSGQFIYAATVLKFVGADFCSPTKQLALVLKPDPTAFSDLDQLYTQILSVYPSTVNIVQVLGFIILDNEKVPEVIEDILGMEEGELKLVLRGLSSLMEDENDENGESLNKGVTSYVIPHFAHASFYDYLFDSSRSGSFHVDLEECNMVFVKSFALIMQLIRSWRMSSITRVLHTATWDFFTSHLPLRFSCSTIDTKEAIMTDINDLVQELWSTSSDGAVGVHFFAIRRLLEILEECFRILEIMSADPISWAWDLDDDQIKAQFKILLDRYRRMFDQLLSKSKDLGDVLRFLPGVVVQEHISMQGMAVLYRIKSELLERLIKSTIEPLRSPNSSPNFRYTLDGYLSNFLQDRDRSQLCYCDPMLQHISICRHFLSLLDGSCAFDLQYHDLSDYVNLHYYDHLCAATTGFLYAHNISDNHPAVEILHNLETTAYYVDENSSGYVLARCIIQAILKWANTLNCRLKGVVVTVSISNVDLMERVSHLRNKIYREMLCITRHERMTNITMGGRLDRVQVSAFSESWTPQYLVLSWDLLAWMSVEGRIPSSLTNFIKTPELSGPLYISRGIYHTQITEYSLLTIFLQNYSRHTSGLYNDFFPNPDWSFREHLSRALPTEMIFYLLQSIRSECLNIRDYLTLDTLEIIIKWLQVSVGT